MNRRYRRRRYTKRKQRIYRAPSLKPIQKISDVSFANFQPTSSSTVLLVNGAIAEGTSHNDRLGMNSTMTSMTIRADIGLGGATIPSAYRIMVMYDRFPNQALPTPSTTIFTGTGPNTHINPFYIRRFQVLYNSGIFTMNALTTFDASMIHGFDLYRPFKLPCEWVGVAGGISAISMGGLYIIITADNAASASSHVFNFSTRLVFNDLACYKPSFRGKNTVSFK